MTGLHFQYAGLSNNLPPETDGIEKGHALIAFYDESKSVPGFEFGNAIGRALAYKDSELSYGYIGIRVPQFNKLTEEAQRQVLAHEFGHILGLGHTTLVTDLMAPIATGHEITYNKVVRKYFKEHPGCRKK